MGLKKLTDLQLECTYVIKQIIWRRRGSGMDKIWQSSNECSSKKWQRTYSTIEVGLKKLTDLQLECKYVSKQILWRCRGSGMDNFRHSCAAECKQANPSMLLWSWGAIEQCLNLYHSPSSLAASSVTTWWPAPLHAPLTNFATGDWSLHWYHLR